MQRRHGLQERRRWDVSEREQPVKCSKCGGGGWLWWFELDDYTGPALQGMADDTRYSCPACNPVGGSAAEGGSDG